MIKFLFILLLAIGFVNILSAQELKPMIIVSGTIYSTDSTAIENAYLISFKTLRAFATDKEGHFEILLEADDSLKIHHISYKSLVINPMVNTSHFEIILEYEDNLIEDVDIRDKVKELKHMECNLGTAMKQLNKEFLSAHTKGAISNVYAPNKPATNMVGLNFIELFDWIKHKRKQ